MLMFNNYTFKKIKLAKSTGLTLWYCSKRDSGCKAAIHTREGQLVEGLTDVIHDHDPPNYVQSKGGWVKV